MTHKSRSEILLEHDEIQEWAESRGAKPARVKSTGGPHDPGLLRFEFGENKSESSLEEISWDEFFEKFDENHLALLVQEETATGEPSNFNKLIHRERKKAA